jgi:ribosomal protein S3
MLFQEFKKFILFFEEKTDEFIVLGLKIIIKGKINGNMRKKKRIIKSKNTPLQTIKNTIDFSSINSTTRYGVFGIKV